MERKRIVSVLLLVFLTSLSFGHFSDHKEVFSSEESAVATEKSNNLNIFAVAGEPKFHSDKFEVTSTSSSQIELNFRSPLITGAYGYIILRADGGDAPDISVVIDGQAPSAFSGHIATITSSGETSYTDTDLIPSQTYTYLLIPFNYDAGDETSYDYLITADQTLPTARSVPQVPGTTTAVPIPSLQNANNISSSGFRVRWDAIDEATSFEVDYSTDNTFTSGVTTIEVTDGAATTQDIGALSSGVTYYYRVRTIIVINAGTTEEATYEGDYSTIGSQITTPAVPTGMAAILATPNGFTLQWNDVTGATSYDVQISTSGASEGAFTNTNNLIVGFNPANTPTNSLVVSDVTKFSASTTYYFRVKAKIGSLESNYSAITPATTGADAMVYLSTTEPDRIICQNDPVSFFAFGADSYVFKRGVDAASAIGVTASGNEYTTTSLANNDIVFVSDGGTATAQVGPFMVNSLPSVTTPPSPNETAFIDDDPIFLSDDITYDEAAGDKLTISGTGVILGSGGYYFYPSAVEEGAYNLTYTVESDNGCKIDFPQTIDIFSGALTLSSKYCSNLDSTVISVFITDADGNRRIPEDVVYERLRFLHEGVEVTNTNIARSNDPDNFQYVFYPSEAFALGMTSITVELRVTNLDPCLSSHPNYPYECDAIANDPCHPEYPYSEPCTGDLPPCHPDYDNTTNGGPNDKYPFSCDIVMSNPCHTDYPYPNECDGCDSRHPNYPLDCSLIMNNPCHQDNPSYPGGCSVCDRRHPTYPYNCSTVMNNPCHVDHPTYPADCDIVIDPCYQISATGRPIPCELNPYRKDGVNERINLLSSQRVPSQLSTASNPDEYTYQTKTTSIELPEIGEITSLNDIYCSSSPDVLLSGTFTKGGFSGTYVRVDTLYKGTATETKVYNFTPGAVVIPDGEAYRTVYINYSYFDNGGCSNIVTDSVKVYRLPETPIVDDIVLCQGDGAVPFVVQNSDANGSITWYSDGHLNNPVGSGSVFNSGVNMNIPDSVVYFVTQGLNGCESISDTVSIVVNALPTNLNMQPLVNTTFCADYQGNIDLYAEPAPLATDTAEFIIGNAVLDFYDTIPAIATTDGLFAHATFVPDSFNVGAYKVHYRLTNVKSCTKESSSEIINIVDYTPTVGFGVSRIQEGEETLFKGDEAIIKNLSSAGQVLDSVYWDFGGEAVVADGDNIDSIYRHQFSGTGVYDVTYSIMTESFCSGQITKKVGIFPVVEVSDDNFYTESFEDVSHGWLASHVLELGNASSWSLSTPQGDTINGAASGANSWITNLGKDNTGNPNNSYNKSEDSWIEGPFFFINNLSRPILSLKIWANTEEGFDGAVVEYSVGDTIEWKTLGSVHEGLEWYNSQGVVGSPGNQSGASFGWSGKIHGDWTLAKFPLDNVHAEAGDEPVRFRVAFASSSDNPFGKNFDGFAFDDFTIESRNRVVLLEHFTNMASSESFAEDGKLRAFVEGRSQEVVDIQYHTSFPGADPLNKVNKADPSARALHYGIAEVPRTVMDGIYGVYYKNEPFFRDSWGVEAYNTRALISAPFNIDITFGDDVSTALEITAEVSKNSTTEVIEGNLIVQLAVVEKQVTVDGNTYYNVVRRLLPNAAGNRLFGDWQPEDTRVERVVQNWNPAVEPGDAEFMIVASVYKENTKEIYQAAFLPIPKDKMPPLAKVTGVDDLLSKEGVTLFPNPTENEINILFPAPLNEEYTLTVYDLHGTEVHRATVKRGAGKITLDTQAYSSGMYSIRLNSGTDQVVRRFVKK